MSYKFSEGSGANSADQRKRRLEKSSPQAAFVTGEIDATENTTTTEDEENEVGLLLSHEATDGSLTPLGDLEQAVADKRRQHASPRHGPKLLDAGGRRDSASTATTACESTMAEVSTCASILNFTSHSAVMSRTATMTNPLLSNSSLPRPLQQDANIMLYGANISALSLTRTRNAPQDRVQHQHVFRFDSNIDESRTRGPPPRARREGPPRVQHVSLPRQIDDIHHDDRELLEKRIQDSNPMHIVASPAGNSPGNLTPVTPQSGDADNHWDACRDSSLDASSSHVYTQLARLKTRALQSARLQGFQSTAATTSASRRSVVSTFLGMEEITLRLTRTRGLDDGATVATYPPGSLSIPNARQISRRFQSLSDEENQNFQGEAVPRESFSTCVFDDPQDVSSTSTLSETQPGAYWVEHRGSMDTAEEGDSRLKTLEDLESSILCKFRSAPKAKNSQEKGRGYQSLAELESDVLSKYRQVPSRGIMSYRSQSESLLVSSDRRRQFKDSKGAARSARHVRYAASLRDLESAVLEKSQHISVSSTSSIRSSHSTDGNTQTASNAQRRALAMGPRAQRGGSVADSSSGDNVSYANLLRSRDPGATYEGQDQWHTTFLGQSEVPVCRQEQVDNMLAASSYSRNRIVGSFRYNNDQAQREGQQWLNDVLSLGRGQRERNLLAVTHYPTDRSGSLSRSRSESHIAAERPLSNVAFTQGGREQEGIIAKAPLHRPNHEEGPLQPTVPPSQGDSLATFSNSLLNRRQWHTLRTQSEGRLFHDVRESQVDSLRHLDTDHATYVILDRAQPRLGSSSEHVSAASASDILVYGGTAQYRRIGERFPEKPIHPNVGNSERVESDSTDRDVTAVAVAVSGEVVQVATLVTKSTAAFWCRALQALLVLALMVTVLALSVSLARVKRRG